MKNTHTCPKCGSTDIVAVPSDSLHLKNGDLFIRVGGAFSIRWTPVHRYVCASCGYVEHWVDPAEFDRTGALDYWVRQEDERLEEERLREEHRKRVEEEKKKEEQAQKERKDEPWN